MIDWEIEQAGTGAGVLVFKLTGHLEMLESDCLLSVVEDRLSQGQSKVALDRDRLESSSSLGLGMHRSRVGVLRAACPFRS